MSTVSVVIPTHNRRELLEQAVETVRLQTHEDVKLVVVDDGSTDRTREYLESFGYDELHAVYHDENQGQSAARNSGIEDASGEYIAFLDSDDLLYPHAVDTLVEAVRAEEAVGAFASAKLVNPRGRVRKRTVPEGRVTEPTLENAREIGGLTGTIFRSCVLDEVGGFDESLDARVDLDLYLRILKRYDLVGVDEFCCERRIHDDGISADEKSVEKGYRYIANKHGLDDPGTNI